MHLLAGFGGFTGVAGSTGLAAVAGLASLPSLIYFIGFTGFARLAGLIGLLTLSAVLVSESVELAHPRAFFVVPPGWWGAVAGVPGVEADQAGTGLGELVDDRVCFGGGEVGGGPARRDDVRQALRV